MATKSYQILFSGTAADNAFYGDVMSLAVEESVAGPGTFHLQLIARMQDDGSWSYLDDDRFALYNKITIKIGFTGSGGLADAIGSLLGGGDGLSTVFDGYVTAVGLNLGSTLTTTFVEVSGMDTSVLMSLEEKLVSWANLADSDIVQQILGNYGVSVTADTTSTVHQDTDTTVLQRATDVQFVRDLARKNGLEFYFETDDQAGHHRFPSRTALDGAPQPTGDPVRQSEHLAAFSSSERQRPLNVKTQQMDIKANSPNLAQVSDTALTKLGDSDANKLIGGAIGSLVTAKDAPAQMLILGSPTSDAAELKTIAQAVRDEAGWLITASGEVNSDAYQAVLRPRRLVLIKGAGKSFSGKYYVTRVIHQINASGNYTQKFDARRNARDVDGSEQFGGAGGLSIPGL